MSDKVNLDAGSNAFGRQLGALALKLLHAIFAEERDTGLYRFHNGCSWMDLRDGHQANVAPGAARALACRLNLHLDCCESFTKRSHSLYLRAAGKRKRARKLP